MVKMAGGARDTMTASCEGSAMHRVVVFALVAAGCSAPAESIAPKPSPFYLWCVAEKFGETSPEGWHATRSDNQVVGQMEIRHWTPCKTKDEAEAHLKAASGRLMRESMARGCQLKEALLQPDRLKLEYEYAGVVGVLDGAMEAAEIELDGRKSPAWYIRLKLTETARP
jgi:hypothetical protein